MDAIEAYCVRCKETVEVVDPVAVWTRKGMPATQGMCDSCGGTVFRMGKTDMHDASQRPDPVEIGGSGKGPKLERDTIYVLFAEFDEALARQIAADLTHAGYAAWLHTGSDQSVQWANGVHPALTECRRMLYVLSAAALDDEQITQSWTFFRNERKPILIAQVGDAAPPSVIRRSPRFDFTSDYKRAFRALMQTLNA
jgi:hypothetical protein